jgi:ComF family protein
MNYYSKIKKTWLGSKISKILEKTIDLIFPKNCLFCQKEKTLFCEDCQSTFDFPQDFLCLCQKPKALIKIGKCISCREKFLDGVLAPLSFDELRVQKLIHAFKYQPFAKELGKSLAEIIIKYFFWKNYQPLKKALIIPIPADPKRIKWRGYNPPEIIAKELAQKFNLLFEPNCLLKIRKTKPQTKLSLEERQENLKNAFALKEAKIIQGKSIYLIDDVYTTGSTMEEAAKILKNAGAKKVFGLVVARAFRLE